MGSLGINSTALFINFSPFEKSLTSDPNNPDLLNLKAAALRSLGRYDEASECYNKSLELDPRDKASS